MMIAPVLLLILSVTVSQSLAQDEDFDDTGFRRKRGVESGDLQTAANTLGAVGFFERRKRDLSGGNVDSVMGNLDQVDWSHALSRKRRGLDAAEFNAAVSQLDKVDWEHAIGRKKRDSDDDFYDDDGDCPGDGCPPNARCDYDGDGTRDGPCGNPKWCDYNGDGSKDGPCGGDGSWCDYDADGDKDGPCGGNGPWCDYDGDGDKDGPCGWNGKGCSGRGTSDRDGCKGLCDNDGDGKVDGPCAYNNGPACDYDGDGDMDGPCGGNGNGPSCDTDGDGDCDAKDQNGAPPSGGKKDNGGVLSNLLGVDRPYGLYGNKP